MRTKILIAALFLSVIFVATTKAQWQPTPSNPWKWYTVQKAINYKGIDLPNFQVLIQYFQPYYQTSELDSTGQLIRPLFATTIYFRAFVTRQAAIDNLDNSIENYATTLPGLPFECEPDGFGVTNDINEYLANRYGVTIDKIVE
jgi:hypothetical protein